MHPIEQKQTGTFNDIGLSWQLDWPRIRKLLTIGLFGAALHFAGDLLLGWGVEDEALEGVLRMLSAYTDASDGRIFAAAILGLIGMTLEGLSLSGIYRLMTSTAPEAAHSYRSGILGYLMFGACGFHVPTCAFAFLAKHGLEEAVLLRYAAYFLLPAFLLFWIFFLVLEITQILAFAKGWTPYPKWCWIFSMPVGMLLAMLPNVFGNRPFVNAMSCAWIAFGCLWMFGGLLVTMKKANSENP